MTIAELRARLPKVILPERATDEQVCHVAAQYIDLLERTDAMSRAKNREYHDAIREHRDRVKCCEPCAAAVEEDRVGADGELWSVLAPPVQGVAVNPTRGTNA